MKQRFLLFTVVFILCASNVVAEINWSTSFNHFRKNSILESSLAYKHNLSDSWKFDFTQESAFGKDKAFDRENRISNNIWRFSQGKGYLTSSILFGYNSTWETGAPASTKYTFERYNRLTGLEIAINPTSNFNIATSCLYSNISNESRSDESQDFSSNQATQVESNGMRLHNNISYHDTLGVSLIDFSGDMEQSTAKHDKYHIYQGNLSWVLPMEQQHLSTGFSYKRRLNNVYSQYVSIDKQKRESYGAEIKYLVKAGRGDFQIKSNYEIQRYRKTESSLKDYQNDYKNIGFVFSYPYRDIRVSVGAEASITDKDFEIDENTTSESYKAVFWNAIFQPGLLDSIVVHSRFDLKQTDVPNANSRTDYDQLNDVIQMGVYYFPLDNCHVQTQFNIFKSEQIYLFSEMSGENNTKTSYNLIPNSEFIFGNRFIFSQSYHIRADYEEFIWNELKENRFFRRLVASWKICYDESDYFANSSTTYWRHLPGQFILEPWTIFLEYKLTENSTGNWINDYFEIHSQRQVQDIIADIQREWNRFKLHSATRITWVDKEREYNQLAEISYSINPSSYAIISVNPVGPDRNNIDWRVNVEIRLEF